MLNNYINKQGENSIVLHAETSGAINIKLDLENNNTVVTCNVEVLKNNEKETFSSTIRTGLQSYNSLDRDSKADKVFKTVFGSLIKQFGSKLQPVECEFVNLWAGKILRRFTGLILDYGLKLEVSGADLATNPVVYFEGSDDRINISYSKSDNLLSMSRKEFSAYAVTNRTELEEILRIGCEDYLTKELDSLCKENIYNEKIKIYEFADTTDMCWYSQLSAKPTSSNSLLILDDRANLYLNMFLNIVKASAKERYSSEI